MKEILIITGPTAVGKSDFAVRCAQKVNGEIISADSMQIYKGLDIGTAKVTSKERSGIPHHMLDIIEPNEDYSVAEYQKSALKIIEDIKKRNKIPIIVGGTGLYINSLLFPLNFAKRSEELRKKLADEYNKFGKEHMHDKLKEWDYNSYQRLHVNDTRRVIRALEIALIGGKHSTKDAESTRYNALIVVLSAPRAILYERINQRVDKMLTTGLIKETQLAIKLCKDQSFQAIGYKEIANYVRGNLSLEEATELLKRSTRNYAKRQLTWFRKYKDANWFDYDNLESALKLVEETFCDKKQ